MSKNFGVWVLVKQEELAAIDPASNLFKRVTETLADRYSPDGVAAVNCAIETLYRDSDFEVDHDAAVSPADDGMYVMGWSWVSDDAVARHERQQKKNAS